MKKVLLPGTDLTLSRLAFGTASLHHLIGTRRQQELLATAADAGITHFDTARMYGEGMAERALGTFLARRRPDFTVSTKIGFPVNPIEEAFPALLYASRAASTLAKRFGRKAGERRRSLAQGDADQSLTTSLRAMRTDWVDILFVHEPRESEIAALLALADWLHRQKRDGRARWLGLSGIAGECVRVAQAMPGLFDVLQVEDSIAGREADALADAGRPIQLTYGYVRRAASGGPGDAKRIMAQALERNRAGAVVFSTRQPVRVREITDVVEGHAPD